MAMTMAFGCDFLLAHDEITVYLDLHGSRPFILTPFGAEDRPMTPAFRELYEDLNREMSGFGRRDDPRISEILLRIPELCRERFEKLCRYAARPPVVH